MATGVGVIALAAALVIGIGFTVVSRVKGHSLLDTHSVLDKVSITLLVQSLVAYRLKRNKMCRSATFHDVANAFSSVDFESVRQTVSGAFPEKHEKLLLAHVEQATCTLLARDGEIHVKAGSGVLPGSSVGPLLFNFTYWGP